MILSNPDHSYMYGFFLADAHLSESSRNRGKLSIELNNIDKEILEKFQTEINCHSKLSERIRNTNFASNVKTCSLSICDLSFRNTLKAYGFPVGAKSETIGVPTTIYVEKDFWRGIIDGDGTLGISKQNKPFIGLFTKSENIAKSFIAFLYKIIKYNKVCNRNKRDNGFNILVSCEDAILVANYLYNGANLKLNRKYIKAQEVIHWKRPDDLKRIKRRNWTTIENEVLISNTIEDSMKILCRTKSSIKTRKWRLSKG